MKLTLKKEGTNIPLTINLKKGYDYVVPFGSRYANEEGECPFTLHILTDLLREYNIFSFFGGRHKTNLSNIVGHNDWMEIKVLERAQKTITIHLKRWEEFQDYPCWESLPPYADEIWTITLQG